MASGNHRVFFFLRRRQQGLAARVAQSRGPLLVRSLTHKKNRAPPAPKPVRQLFSAELLRAA